MLETHMKLCMTAGFFGKTFLPSKIGKMGQKCFFFVFIRKFGHSSVLNLFFNETLHYLLCSCTNFIFGENIKIKIALNQSDCRIFKSTFCMYKFTKIKNWNFFWVGMVKDGCGQFIPRYLKLTLIEEWTDEINWCWYKFRET